MPFIPKVLASVYLSPARHSNVIHVVEDLDHLLCLPRVPLGKFVLRSDIPEITCPNCLKRVQDACR